ncbi:MAG: single-stranded DNA-binding protein [Planctomycetes bacterium]|nr:single-stranded DNA-binding protein [Planctomycetota bacterium]
MASLNKVLLMGNMTRDPQLSYLPSQTAVVEFGLAMTRKFKKQDGSMAEDTCFVDCQIFGKRAEVINQYFKKGSPIFIEGRLKLDTWEKDGQKRSRLRVFVENFEFIGGRGGKPAEHQDASAEAPAPDVEPSYGGGAGGGDEIPF